MKLFTPIFLFALLLTTNCASKKNKAMYSIESTPPFTIVEATSQKWVAGIKEGGSGVNVNFKVESISEEISLQSMFFEGMETPIQNIKENFYQASFTIQKGNEIVMDIDPNKEAQNTPPVKIPFELENGEAVVSYLENNELKYYKISDIEAKQPLYLPSSNQGNELNRN